MCSQPLRARVYAMSCLLRLKKPATRARLCWRLRPHSAPYCRDTRGACSAVPVGRFPCASVALQTMIMNTVRESVGFVALNNLISDRMRDWVQSTVASKGRESLQTLQTLR